MVRYDILPGVGVGPIRLGMSRDEVHQLLGEPPDQFNKTGTGQYDIDAYHHAGFQVFYAGDTPHVEYIELSSGSGFTARYKGIDVFSTKADELVAIILQDAAIDESGEEPGYAFIVPALELSLWRPVIPESADAPEGHYFATIGVGTNGYYSGQ